MIERRVSVDRSPLACPRCREPVDVDGGDWVACGACLARHHRGCWKEEGACACGGSEALEPATARTRAAPVARAIPGRPLPPRTRNLIAGGVGAALLLLAALVTALTLANTRVPDPDEPNDPPHLRSEAPAPPIERVADDALYGAREAGPAKLVRAWRWRSHSAWRGEGHAVAPGLGVAERATGLKLFDLSTGAVAHALPVHWAGRVLVSPRGELAIGRDSGLELWDLRDQHRTRAHATGDATGVLAFSPDGTQLAVGQASGRVLRVSLGTGRVETLGEGKEAVTALALDDDGHVFWAHGGRIGSSRDPRFAIQHESPVRALAVRGRTLHVAGSTLGAYDLETRAPIWWARRGLGVDAKGAAFAPDGRRVLVTGDDLALLLETTTAQELGRITLGTPRAVHWSNDGRALALGTDRLFAIEYAVAEAAPHPLDALSLAADRALATSDVRKQVEEVRRRFRSQDPWADEDAWNEAVRVLRTNRSPAALAVVREVAAIAGRSKRGNAAALAAHAIDLLSGGSDETEVAKMTATARDAYVRALCRAVDPLLRVTSAPESVAPGDLVKTFRDALGPANRRAGSEPVFASELTSEVVKLLLGPFAEDARYRWHSARLLALARVAGKAPELPAAAADASRPANVRVVAAVALWDAGETPDLDGIARLLETEKDPTLRATVAAFLARAQAVSALPVLVRLESAQQGDVAEVLHEALKRDFTYPDVCRAIQKNLDALPRDDREAAARLINVAVNAGLDRTDRFKPDRELRSLVLRFVESRLAGYVDEDAIPVHRALTSLYSLTGEQWVDYRNQDPAYVKKRAAAFVARWRRR